MQPDFALDAELITLCTNLSRTFLAANPEEQKAAEDYLQKLSQTDTLNFLIKLNAIILDKSCDDKVKLAASSYLHKVIRMISYPNTTQPISSDNKVHLCTMLYNTLNAENVIPKVKRNIQDAFGAFLCDDHDNSLKNKLITKITEHMMTTSPNEIMGVLYTISAILKSINISVQINLFFSQIINSVCNMAQNIYLHIISSATAYSQAEAEKNITNSQIAIKSLLMNVEIISVWVDTVENFIYKMNDMRDHSLKNVLANENLTNLLSQILFLNLATNKQIKDCIFSTTGMPDLDNCLNTVKISILQIFKKLIDFILEAPSGFNYNLSQFFVFLHTCIPNLIVSLNKLVNNEFFDIEELLPNDHVVENLIVESMALLSKCTSQIEFYKIFSDWKKTLIVEIILVFLTTSSLELETFNNNPEEFVALALDTCDKQASETYKTQAAQLLESLCDHIDGTLTQITYLVINIMKYSIECNNPNEIQQKFPLLSEFASCKYIKKKSAELRIESGLLILTVISYLIPKRQDLVKVIEDFFTTYLKFFSTTTSDLIKSRLCLFLGYYLDTILLTKDHDPIYSVYLKFILDNLVMINTRPDKAAISYQAIDALNSVFEDDDSVVRLSSFIKDLFPTIFQLIPVISEQKFLEMIQSIVKYYGKYLMDCEELTSQLIQELVNKILQEKKNLENDPKKKKITISMMRCWNTLRTIADSRYFVPKCLHIIENKMTPLYEIMKSGDSSFDDDLICFITQTLKNVKKLTDKMQDIFIYFSRYFEQKEGVFGPLFTTLNYYIVYDPKFCVSDAKYVEMLVIMGTEALNAKGKNANEASQADGALMLHLLIQKFSEFLNPKQLEKIFDRSLERLAMEIKHDFLKAKIYGVFLSAFIYCFPQVQKYLMGKNCLREFIEKLIEKIDVYVHTYDRKIFINGMSALLARNEFSEIISLKALQIIDCLVTILKIQQMAEIKEKEKRKNLDLMSEDEEDHPNKNYLSKGLGKISNQELYEDDEDDEDIEDDFDDDEDDDENFDDEEGIDFSKENEEYEAKIRSNTFANDIDKIDEFNSFKEAIFMLKNKDQQGLHCVFTQLTAVKQEFLRQVLSSQRIAINDNPNNKSAPRKIVKVKGKKKIGETPAANV